jgi:F0F1-type ATP synthase membrane subunit c/vacuolar-type H+-ATPase subunit K
MTERQAWIDGLIQDTGLILLLAGLVWAFGWAGAAMGVGAFLIAAAKQPWKDKR